MVIRVDERDREVGVAGKLEAHVQGLLHRAFSVQLFTPQGEWLLQRRARHKYHSGGLWSNTCCSHPAPGAGTEEAAARRLREEMGLTAVLRPGGTMLYRAEVGRGLVEYEFDHLFTGIALERPRIDPAEVAEYRYVATDALLVELERHPERFTVWFRLLAPRLAGAHPAQTPERWKRS